MVREQLELAGVPRKRERLLMDLDLQSGEALAKALDTDDSFVWEHIRIPAKVAAHLMENKNPSEVTARALARGLEEFIGYTKWECEVDPPMPGWWEVTDHQSGTLLARWWFDMGSTWWRAVEKDGQVVSLVDAMAPHVFRRLYAWRGLLNPHPSGYALPPYMGKQGELISQPTRERVRIV